MPDPTTKSELKTCIDILNEVLNNIDKLQNQPQVSTENLWTLIADTKEAVSTALLKIIKIS